MQRRHRARTPLAILVLLTASLPAPLPADAWGRQLPWREAGLTERQAAAHLLDRFAYGPRPGEIDAVVEQGLGNWIEGQLAGDLPGSLLASKLARLPALTLAPREIVLRYSYSRLYIAQQAIAAGVIAREDYAGERGERRLQNALARLDRFAAERGLHPGHELLAQLRAQKLLRAVYAHSQLVEVLTDFWFNHFNVSATGGASGIHLLSYERDAIRPHALTTFRRLLGATARHPAMLIYLDNAQSVASARTTTLFDLEIQELRRLSPLDNPSTKAKLAQALGWRPTRGGRDGPPRGLNENYARELLELHTLGFGGGYGQDDVIEVARAFTGWTTFPGGGARARIEAALSGPDTATVAAAMGFVAEDEFVFRADQHDSEAKAVFGVPLAAGRGIEDGEEVLDLLARHPSTREHLAHKLAVRFVSDRPPPALVRRLVETWEITGGDLKELVRALVESPDFWSETARRSKIKTPFELAASALRALDAEVADAAPTLAWITRMGQPVYGYAAPTGFPDRGEAWLDVGPLLARLNFALELARGKIPGVTLDLLRRAGQRPLGSVEEAIEVYLPHLMPERDPRLMLDLIGRATAGGATAGGPLADPAARRAAEQHAARAVGILIGSPEFQVR